MGPQNYCENLKCKLENDKREEEKRKRIETKQSNETSRDETRKTKTENGNCCKVITKSLRVSLGTSAEVLSHGNSAVRCVNVYCILQFHLFVCVCA